jgi:uncharacterized cofD-like protein
MIFSKQSKDSTGEKMVSVSNAKDMNGSARNPRIVCIGGGTGLHAELTGLKEVLPEARLSAVVTMMDSGSNSGKLRDEFGYLPPGDARQCLVALSDAPYELRALMQYRFSSGKSDLDGHVIGNILLTALKEMSGGDEYAAIEAMERILGLRGRVFPVTLTDAHIVATLVDGTVVKGEGNLYGPDRDNAIPIASLALEPQATLFDKTRDAIEEADIIIIGPGGLHHSILPNLIVHGMRDALRAAKTRGARILLVTNIMTKHGDTSSYHASHFLDRVQAELGDVKIDLVIANSGVFSDERIAAYASESAEPIMMDIEGHEDLLLITRDLVSDQAFLKHGKESFARHHPQKLASAVRDAILLLRKNTSGGR